MKNQREIKVVSFDVWNTLIKPNAGFGNARSRFLSGYLHVPESLLSDRYTRIKKHVDGAAENFGMSYSNLQCWQMLTHELVGNEAFWVDYDYIVRSVEKLFLKYPPQINEHLVEYVKRLGSNGYLVGFASNSNFISGKFMLPYLNNIFGGSDFAVFSDLEPFAKPHPKFFMEICHQTETYPSEVLHVGDHLICDGRASRVGFKTVVAGNIETIFDKVGQICYG